MAIDYPSTAVGIANLIFVQPNMPATLDVSELQSLAQAIDTQMSADLASFTAGLPQNIASALTTDQLNKAMGYVAMKRAGLA